MLDPANTNWRHDYATTHMIECYCLEGAGQIEAARQALKRFDSLIQDLPSPEAQGRLKVDDKEVLARIESLRGVAEANRVKRP